MTTSPFVSVIIPTYNGERFLREAIESVIAQDYHPIEIIVIDDGSTDRTPVIAQSYNEVRYVQQAHAGVAAARNLGVAGAQGDLIAFLDQDDYWLRCKLQRQVAFLMEHPTAEYVLAGSTVHLEEDIELPQWVNQEAVEAGLMVYMPSSWLVRRSAFDRVCGFNTSYEMASDAEWLARANDAGVERIILPEAVCCWRLHGANHSYNQQRARAEAFRLLRESAQRKRAR